MVVAALLSGAAQVAWPQGELPAPFAGIPVVDAVGSGNPASGRDGRDFVLSVAGDSVGYNHAWEAQTWGLAGRWNGFTAAYRLAMSAGDYAGENFFLGQSLPLGALGRLGADWRFADRDGGQAAFDFGWQAEPLPELRLGYVLRDAVDLADKPPLEHEWALGLRPWGRRVDALGGLEWGGGATIQRAHWHPYTFAQLPVARGLGLWGYWAPRSGRIAASLTAALSPTAHLGLGTTPRHEPGFRLDWSQPPTPKYLVSTGCVREVDLNHPIVMDAREPGWFASGGLDWEHLLQRLDFLENDPTAKVVVLRLGNLRADFATAEELHDRILRLRARGKRVFAYLEPEITPMNYLVASAADRVAAQPQGYFAVPGFAAEVTFYKGLLDKIGIEAQFLRHGKAKSFVEPFTRTGFTPASRENLRQLLNGWWDEYVTEVSSARGLSADSLRAFLDRGEIDLDSARAQGLIDTLLQPDQVAAAAAGSAAPVCKENATEIAGDSRWSAAAPIAVAALNGEITAGESRARGLFGGETMGAETVVRLLERLRHQGSVRAVVLRLDSPGGEVEASDRIAREIDLLRRDGKKVVVSVGGEAASGAYYVACRADAIVAEPGAVVGSIGVLWGKVVTQGLYGKLGLTREDLKTAPHADALSGARPWTPEEVAVLQRHLDRFYAEFLAQVKERRGSKITDLDSAAEGRVFTGTQGLRLGLVDTLGGLELAERVAAKMAGIPLWEATKITRYYSPAGFPDWGNVGAVLGIRAPSLWDDLAAGLEEWSHPQLWALDPALAATVGPMR